MSISPELQTIESFTPQLETLLKNSDRDLVHFLYQEGFIGSEVREDVLNPRSMLTDIQKAGRLVQAIRDAVEVDKQKYHLLVQHLSWSGTFYDSIVQALTEEYRVRETVTQEPTPQHYYITGTPEYIGVAN